MDRETLFAEKHLDEKFSRRAVANRFGWLGESLKSFATANDWLAGGDLESFRLRFLLTDFQRFRLVLLDSDLK